MSYQLFDALPAHIEDALRASIERFGVLVPVVRDQHGNTIDGHHRARIADELGVSYRTDTVTVADEDEAREIARHLNSRRRHLSGEQLREHIVMLAQRATPNGVGELSQNEIAQVAGVSQQYVNKVLADPEVTTSSNLPDSRRGADGKVYPARRSVPDPEPDPEHEHAPSSLFSDVADDAVEALPEPDPEPPAELMRQLEEAEVHARLAEELDAEMEGTAVRFRRNFAAAAVKAGEITTFDPDRISEVFTGNWDRDVGDLLRALSEWCSRVAEARRCQQRAGLRIVGGESNE